MAEHQQPPWSLEQVYTWITMQIQTPFLNAVNLNNINLGVEETGILDVGCANGSCTLAAYRQQSSLTGIPATVVGIDNCQAMITIAEEALNKAAIMDSGAIRNHVSFRCMDVMRFGEPATIQAIRALFPRGISTILATCVFCDMGHPDAQRAVRNLLNLVRPGGRVVLGTSTAQTEAFTTVFILNHNTYTCESTIDIAPPSFRQYTIDSVRNACQQISGRGPGGVTIDIASITCEWQASILQAFTARINTPDTQLVYVNDEAGFDPQSQQLFHTRSPPVIAQASPRPWVHATVHDLLNKQRTPAAIFDEAVNLMTAAIMNDGKQYHSHQHRLKQVYQKPDLVKGMLESVTWHLEAAAQPHGIKTAGNRPQLGGNQVLVTLRRA